jgi:hypothetical protein
MYLILLLLALVPFQLVAVDPTEPTPTPLMRIVEPSVAKIGMEITVTGQNLGKECVAEVYMTQGKASYKVEVIEQTQTELKFKVPANVPPAAYRLTVLMKGAVPLLIEEPVRLIIEP